MIWGKVLAPSEDASSGKTFIAANDSDIGQSIAMVVSSRFRKIPEFLSNLFSKCDSVDKECGRGFNDVSLNQ